MKGALKYCLMMVVLVGLVVTSRAHEFGDDHGDCATNATGVTIGSNVVGRIEIDTDEDWFSFPVSSLKEYEIQAVTGTLWDTTAAAIAGDGVYVLGTTDSVVSVTSGVSWIHFGPSTRAYAHVGGFADFTTGTYGFAVAERNFTDHDQDGMADGWERSMMGSTNPPASGLNGDMDQDGVDNRGEFMAGTDPSNVLSRLEITAIRPVVSGAIVEWRSAPLRTYRLMLSTNLMDGAAWRERGWVTNYTASALSLTDSQEAGATSGMYRVECVP